MSDLFASFNEQALWVQSLIGLLLLALAALAVNFLLKKVILRAAAPFLDKKTDTSDKAIAWLATVIPLLIVSRGINFVPNLQENARLVVTNVAQGLIVLSIAMAIVKALTYANEVYERRPISKNRPIKGYLQVLKIVVLCGAAIIVISVLIGESPIVLLGGLGAMAAVVLLVFKDTILSLVASVQLSSNDMLRVGDWIQMPSMNADGDVIDIALHTVKVQNFDKTITTIPTHRLISDAFINWRGMKDAGGRRIKRAVHLDQNTIRFLDDDEIARLSRFRLIKPYLDAKRAELDEWNARTLSEGDDLVNARRITNIGTLRAYAVAYMKDHPRVRDKGFTLMARQLAPTPQGVPLELYCFAATTEWPVYEGIQSDIFDHILAIIPEFGLRVFQEPSGLDLAEGLQRLD
ncbi:miniconductance mechanosensitive channel [Erythrobacter litoralis]|jgi:miniconductance mechanosensitive channel|uniref:Mechanosensing system component YbdG n=1 Tax=Erythrobacter litoralis TaxID=39960 RepID=A0A074M9Z6_9SPHN|nr:mechanosensitive ion channel domain-containing protein [Erythrobacter litoralis]AOL22291.1 miniconductance mechanosensitive channel [Erythrobacter litoralis]KEO89580.1 mechanosensitive ion channel protein MscS [Erythrobacter litoralis]MEE4337384.1 mechanosensitive ion channel domain-containing protein [Erythrobacter sp.]